jgi:peptidyl-prolyl cis-trans isomerase A (cyclophilin A)
MRNRSLSVAALLCALMAASCSSNAPEKKTAESAKPAGPVKVPDVYSVKLETSKGDVVVEVNRAWAPRGADRFHELVRSGFYDGARFYRVRKKFVAQFGISADPKANELWRQLKMPDDPVKQSNKRGTLSFAQQGAGSRTTQVFINLANNGRTLDSAGFAPFAKVVQGMDAVDAIYSGYGEVQSLGGGGPDPIKMELQGDEYVERSYPRLDKIKTAKILE